MWSDSDHINMGLIQYGIGIPLKLNSSESLLSWFYAYTCTCTLKATIVARECEQIVDKVHFHCKRKTWIVIIECCECHIVVCNLCRSWSLEMICEKSSFTVNLYVHVDVHIFMSIIVKYMCIPVITVPVLAKHVWRGCFALLE